MHTNILSSCIATLALSLPTLLSAAPREGTYRLSPWSKWQTGVVTISAVKPETLRLDLEVTMNPSPSGDGAFERMGAIEGEELPLRGNVALYIAREPEHCVLALVFPAPGRLDIEQFGACSLFGHAVSAGGRYVLLKAKPIKR